MVSASLNAALTFLSVVLIHEAGHVFAAALFGARVSGFGAVGSGLRLRIYGAETLSYGRVAAVYAGGAAFNLISLLLPGMGERFRLYSVGVAVFNLIPLRGSDGDLIIYTLLSALSDPFRGERIRRAISSFTLLVFWCAAVLVNLTGGGNLPMLLAVTAVIIAKYE